MMRRRGRSTKLLVSGCDLLSGITPNLFERVGRVREEKAPKDEERQGKDDQG
jgi:hypothetical protein